jgi:hypothetical protein
MAKDASNPSDVIFSAAEFRDLSDGSVDSTVYIPAFK